MEYKVDYHFHSTFSDGTKRPTELVKWYKNNGYDEIALTDHDGIDGIKEAKIAAEALGIQVISGVEISTNLSVDFKNKPIDVHVLGYRFDENNAELISKLKGLRRFRAERNDLLIKKLNEMGYEISYEDILKCTNRSNQTYIGKPNIADTLVDKGYIKNRNDAFEDGKFLESPEIKAIKKEQMNIADAIHLIKDAGGIAVIAHPMEIFEEEKYFVEALVKCSRNIPKEYYGKQKFFKWLFEELKKLKRQGLGGLECYHPSASEEDSHNLVKIAEKLKLHITRGSDYHGL